MNLLISTYIFEHCWINWTLVKNIISTIIHCGQHNINILWNFHSFLLQKSAGQTRFCRLVERPIFPLFLCALPAPGSPAYEALVEITLIMGNSEKRKRFCTVCGKPAKGHVGRIGPGRCNATPAPPQGDSSANQADSAPKADTVQASVSGASGGARPKEFPPPPLLLMQGVGRTPRMNLWTFL